jgi:hypothetical protein
VHKDYITALQRLSSAVKREMDRAQVGDAPGDAFVTEVGLVMAERNRITGVQTTTVLSHAAATYADLVNDALRVNS